MADYTNYNHSSSNKGPILALLALAALVIGIFVLAANAPVVQEGAVSGDAVAIETAPAVTEGRSSITDSQ
jgi:hypothetical protein